MAPSLPTSAFPPMASSTTDAPFFFSAGMSMPGGDAGGWNAGGPVATGGGAAASSADDLVRETRREIAEIVREVAVLARQNLDRSHFFSALIDRTVRALAAEGAVIWDVSTATHSTSMSRVHGRLSTPTGHSGDSSAACEDRPRPRAVVRTGRVTDQQISALGRPAHDRMLAEIVASGNPVVVPPTPLSADSLKGTDDNQATARHRCSDTHSDLAANPTDRPAAVVPILDPLESSGESAVATGSRYVLEVFLESEAGIATQRGYLRFAAQMADLAGDFLRLDEIRRARLSARLDAGLHEILTRLHRHDTLNACAAEIVDAAAELLDAARATLVRVGHPSKHAKLSGKANARRSRILAISHVEAIDHRGAACGRLLDQTLSYDIPPGQSLWAPESSTVAGVVGPSPADAVDPDVKVIDDAPLFPMAVIALGDSGQYRLFLQSTWPAAMDDAHRRIAQRFAVHAAAALRSAARVESIPFARAWLACLPAGFDSTGQFGLRPLIRRLILPAIALLVVGTVGMMPRSMTVTLPATLRPESVRTHYAPCDALVQEVLVRHGQQVTAGQPMLMLRDVTLDEQTTTLIARRAVVGEKLSRVLASLVQAPGGRSSSQPNAAQASDDALVQQQRLFEEELRGIEQQLELLADARERLVLRSDRDGHVDAWQTERMALGRPVRTGEPLLRVQPLLPRWVADAKVPQNRGEIVFSALGKASQHPVRVRLEDAERDGVRAHYVRHTGYQTSAAGGPRAALVEFRLELPEDTASETRWQSGAPVEVAIDCGTLPLAHVLFFDFIRSIRLQWAKWS